jgi:Uma2 family endonuclease
MSVATTHTKERCLSVPDWVVDIDSFRHWTERDNFPDTGSVWWLRGAVWIDMSREQIFTHNHLKTRIISKLDALVEEGDLGLMLSDGVLLSNFDADISGNPDGTFLLKETLTSDRVRLIEGRRDGYTEVQGSADMVLEVVSDSSIHKDHDLLRKAYWEAGIREYWLVDARKPPLKFEILRYTPRGYVATRKQDGWVKSSVFGKSFRLTQRTNTLGHPEFKLDVR